MKQINLLLSISLMIVSLVFGMVFGYYISPSYKETMFSKDEMGLGKADKFVDLRYINQMAVHHKGAIALADQIDDQTKREELKKLAKMIQEVEPKLIEELYNWKKDWYKDNRSFDEPVVAKLGEYDESFDLRFLNALIAHHEDGIEMTKEIRTKSSNSDILNNADIVEKVLTDGIVMLKKYREEWYEVK